MKKLVLSLGLSFGLIAGAFAENIDLDQLNSQVQEVLAPFQNQTTMAQLAFDTVEINTERTEKVAIHALYRKVGPQNTFELKVDNLSYDYGDGSSPITILKGSIGLDVTKMIPQEDLNHFIPMAAQFVEGIAKDYSREYKDAVSVKGVVTSTPKDNDGNFTGLTALFSMKIDLSKLPEDKKSEEVMATDIVLALNLNLHEGLSIDAFMVSNPNYLRFNEDQDGLKETLNKLLANDEEVNTSLRGLVVSLDDMASKIVTTLNLWKNFATAPKISSSK